MVWTCTTAANPRTINSTATTTWARPGRDLRARHNRCRPTGAVSGGVWSGVSSGGVCSGMEHVPSDRGDIREDADAQYHDDTGRQLAADAELVAEVDDQAGDQHVRYERHDEDLVVEPAVEERAERAEHGIERGDDRNREVGLQSRRDRWLEHESEHDARDQADNRDHWVSSPVISACRTVRRPFGAAGSVRFASLLISNCIP